MKRLDESAFRATFGSRMQRVNRDGAPPVDIWPYFDNIPESDFEGYDCSDGIVRWAWRTEDDRFEHILVSTKNDEDVFMAVVVDLESLSVYGHRLLNLKTEYGIKPAVEH